MKNNKSGDLAFILTLYKFFLMNRLKKIWLIDKTLRCPAAQRISQVLEKDIYKEGTFQRMRGGRRPAISKHDLLINRYSLTCIHKAHT